jgi:hypothetical protein
VRLRNDEDYRIYPYVLDISSDGSVTLLYPQIAGAQEAVPPRSARDLVTIETFVPDGFDSVTDTFKVIATAKPIDPSVFPQGPVRSATSHAPEATGDPLTDFLSRATRGLRGSKIVRTESWGTADRIIEVMRLRPR